MANVGLNYDPFITTVTAIIIATGDRESSVGKASD